MYLSLGDCAWCVPADGLSRALAEMPHLRARQALADFCCRSAQVSCEEAAPADVDNDSDSGDAADDGASATRLTASARLALALLEGRSQAADGVSQGAGAGGVLPPLPLPELVEAWGTGAGDSADAAVVGAAAVFGRPWPPRGRRYSLPPCFLPVPRTLRPSRASLLGGLGTGWASTCLSGAANAATVAVAPGSWASARLSSPAARWSRMSLGSTFARQVDSCIIPRASSVMFDTMPVFEDATVPPNAAEAGVLNAVPRCLHTPRHPCAVAAELVRVAFVTLHVLQVQTGPGLAPEGSPERRRVPRRSGAASSAVGSTMDVQLFGNSVATTACLSFGDWGLAASTMGGGADASASRGSLSSEAAAAAAAAADAAAPGAAESGSPCASPTRSRKSRISWAASSSPTGSSSSSASPRHYAAAQRSLSASPKRLTSPGVRRLGAGGSGWGEPLAALKKQFCELQVCSPAELEHEQRLAFWLNVLNAATLAWVAVSDRRAFEGSLFRMSAWAGFLQRCRLIVGGTELSLFEIEHLILRARSNPPAKSGWGIFALPCAKATTNPSTAALALRRQAPEVSFGIAYPLRAGYPPLRVFRPEVVKPQLLLNCACHLVQYTSVDVHRRRATLPPLLRNFQRDFAESPSGLLRFARATLRAAPDAVEACERLSGRRCSGAERSAAESAMALAHRLDDLGRVCAGASAAEPQSASSNAMGDFDEVTCEGVGVSFSEFDWHYEQPVLPGAGQAAERPFGLVCAELAAALEDVGLGAEASAVPAGPRAE